MNHFLKVAAILLMLAGAQGALPQADNAHIRSGAKVFVEKMDGFEDNFIAALHTKQVPVVVVTDKDKADFFFSGYCPSYRSERQSGQQGWGRGLCL